jgi:signal transduction histidine kinase
MNGVVSFLRKLGLLPKEQTTEGAKQSRSEIRSASTLASQRDSAVHLAQTLARLENRTIEEPQSHAIAYQTLWLQELIRRLLARRDQRMAKVFAQATPPSSPDRQEQTRKMMTRLSSNLNAFAHEFNALTVDIARFDQIRLTIGDLRDVTEESSQVPYGMTPKGSTPSTSKKSKTYLRYRLSTSSWCLSLRGYRDRIECFLVPATELFLLSQSETPSRLRSVFTQSDRLGTNIWTIDGLPAPDDELYYVCRNLLKTLLLASAQDTQEEMDRSSLLETLEGDALKTAVRELLFAEQNMAQKIVSQQEEIQNRIARDLHDAVIADIMALKRSLSENAALSGNELSSALDSICQRIREICHDLTPRDLRDWGLQTVIEDLLERVSQRTSADCSLECERDLPEFPYPVQLHLFRIVQECLNNIEKYAGASRVIVKFEVLDQVVRLTMTDDGKGYEASDLDGRRAREGGWGLSGIRERAEMIRCFYPTKLSFQSQPGRGSKTVLEMRLSEAVGSSVRD